MRDGVELIADHYEPQTVQSGGHAPGPRSVRPRRGRFRRCSRAVYAVAGLPRHRAKRSRHVRLRWRVQPDGPRDRRRRRHRGLAARPAVVHRFVRHRRGFLPRLHPVGPADRSAAGDEGRGHHRRPARSQRPALGYRFVRAQRFPRLVRPGRPPGGSGPHPRPRPPGSGRDGRWPERPARCPSARRAGHCSARARRGSSPGSSIPSTTTRTGRRCSCIRRWSARRSRCCCSADGRTCFSSRRWRSTNVCVSAGCRSASRSDRGPTRR